MAAISLYRGNLHLSAGAEGAAPRRWEPPRPAITAKRFRRLLHGRSLAVARLVEEAPPLPESPAPSSSGEGQQHGEGEQQEPPEEGEIEQQQQQMEEQEEGAVEDGDVNDAGEVLVEDDGNGDAEEGQGESEGLDQNQEEVEMIWNRP